MARAQSSGLGAARVQGGQGSELHAVRVQGGQGSELGAARVQGSGLGAAGVQGGQGSELRAWCGQGSGPGSSMPDVRLGVTAAEGCPGQSRPRARETNEGHVTHGAHDVGFCGAPAWAQIPGAMPGLVRGAKALRPAATACSARCRVLRPALGPNSIYSPAGPAPAGICGAGSWGSAGHPGARYSPPRSAEARRRCPRGRRRSRGAPAGPARHRHCRRPRRRYRHRRQHRCCHRRHASRAWRASRRAPTPAHARRSTTQCPARGG